jgi:predicted PurR-regulated permease PerM
MTLQRQVLFWLGALALLLLALFVLRDVLLPFVAGMFLAYLLNPVANWLEQHGLSRLIATLLILVLFVLIFVLAMVLLVPLLGTQVSGFVSKMPDYVSALQGWLTQQGGPLLERFGGSGQIIQEAQKSLADVVGQGAAWAGRLLQSLWAGGAALVNIVSLLVVTPIVAFYLLLDWDSMVKKVDGWLPRQYRETIRQLIGEMDQAIAAFIRGQAAVCVVLGTFYAIGLSLMGLNFGVLIGMVSGFLSFIPYVGSLIGLVLSVGVALVQFWPDWTMPLVALAIFALGQFLEGNLLSPWLVGNSIGLHPVWLMFALLAFGSLFGFVGLLVAVPLAAVVGVLIRFGIGRYLESAYYLGPGAARAPKPGNSKSGS